MSNQANWALVISGYTTVFAILVGFLVYIFKHGVEKVVRQLIADEITPVIAQLKNNGGNSVKDTVDKTFKMVNDLTVSVAKLETRTEALERSDA